MHGDQAQQSICRYLITANTLVRGFIMHAPYKFLYLDVSGKYNELVTSGITRIDIILVLFPIPVYSKVVLP